MPRGAGHKQQNESGNGSIGSILFPLHSCCAKGYRLQMATEISAVAQILHKKKKKEMRNGCTYSKEELAVLLPYKEQYRSKTSHDDRDKLLRSSILVDIFNHWLSAGVDLTEVEVQKREKVRQLQAFSCRRSFKSFGSSASSFRNFVGGWQTIGAHTDQLIRAQQLAKNPVSR